MTQVTAPYAENYLTTPTYDGSGQAIHPDIVDFGSGNTWNGYRYWMAMTPYPNNDETKENPSILVSADGDTWVEPEGITNPISGTEGYADPDLIYDNNTLYCIWIKNNGTTGIVYVSSSTDGVTWTAKQNIYQTNGNLKGPAVVKVGSTFYMYFSDNQASMTIYRLSSTAMTGTWGDLTACVLDNVPQNSHVEMVYADSRYYLYADNSAYFGYSDDGLHFTINPTDIFTGERPAWCQNRYRGTMVRTATGFDFWYSGNNGSGVWHTGRTAMTPA